MDSDSDSNRSIRSSGTAAFRPSATIPLSPSPDDPQFEPGPRGEQFLMINHTANQRNRSEISKIRFRGGERRRIDNGSNSRFWRCSHPDRNQLTEDIIETCECLKAWWKKD